MLHKKKISAEIPHYENVQYELRDKDGNLKAMFQDNFLNRAFLKLIRKYVPNPIENGQVKPGLFNYLSAYGLRIPGLTGIWTTEMHIANLVVSAGKAGIASRINGSGAEAAFLMIGIGTGVTAAAAGDTTLGTEVTASGGAASGVHAVAAATASRVTTSVTNDTAQMLGTISITGTIAVTESGVFNATTNGTLLCRQTFSAINVVNGDSLQLTWKVQAS